MKSDMGEAVLYFIIFKQIDWKQPWYGIKKSLL